MLTFMKMGKINHATYVSNILIISCEDTVSFHKEPEQASVEHITLSAVESWLG